jgi:hypothetical protein
MTRRLSATRKLSWLDMARYKAMAMRAAPPQEAYWPKCNRCDADVGAVHFEDRKNAGKSYEFRARCDHPEHQGSREDVIRADFDWQVEPGSDDFNRALRSCIFFPRANDV